MPPKVQNMCCILNWLRKLHSFQQAQLSRKVTAQAPPYPCSLASGFGVRGFEGKRLARSRVGCNALRGRLGELDVIHDLNACRGFLQEFEQHSMGTGIQFAGQRQSVAGSRDLDSVGEPGLVERSHDLPPPLGSGG